MRTGILVHGCNLNVENWRHVAWGDPPNQLGRIPKGMLLAHQLDAESIVFGTGASQKEFRLGTATSAGSNASAAPRTLLESEYSEEYLRQHFDELRKFHSVRQLLKEAGDDQQWSTLRSDLLGRITLDKSSQNTQQEILAAADLFLSQEIQQIVLVSSPSHIVRCLRDAMSIFSKHEKFQPFSSQLLAVPSMTCYEGTEPGDVVVVEPPHRPDRHVIPTHRRIQRMMTLQNLGHDDLVQLIEEFDDLLQRFEHKFFSDQGSG